jgi:putative protein-disulfide isomerase
MCSWCWGFRATWLNVIDHLPESVSVVSLLGGLASDSDQPMPTELQAMISSTWKTIQQRIPDTRFDHSFWHKCQPRRSTYPACRAVIAARNQHPSVEQAMVLAIQQAYYLNAQNPSDNAVLIDLAKDLVLDITLFEKDLSSEQTQQQLNREILHAKTLGATGFPSLVLEYKERHSLLKISYNDPEKILKQVLGFFD